MIFLNNTSIIILTYNNLNYTKECLDSIKKYTKEGTYEIIIVDNNSTDGTVEYLKSQPDLKVIYNKENMGFPKGCNQGISLASNSNDILLLNNDTIVTNNWLDNLKKCLYSSPTIGAVGPVCNQNENRQGVAFKYQNLEEMQKKAWENNKSDKNKWEEKVFLIGFCLLIKREVINKLNGLDEEFTPGYIEDNDLSLRIINLGYRLMLCHDTFIHHYLGSSFRKDLNKFYPVLNKNRDYFFKKWHFDTFTFDDIKEASFPLIEKTIKILDINCGIGVTALALKYQYPNIIVDGVENDDNKRLFSFKFIDVYKKIDYLKDHEYDYILIKDLLEKIKNPQNFLQKIKKYLKKDGYLIGEIHNPVSVKNLNYILNGYCYELYKNQTNLFTINDIKNLLKKANYEEPYIFSWYETLSKEEEKLIKLIDENNKNIYYTYYTFKTKVIGNK